MSTDPALRALNRFGLGARPGERARLRDPRGWLLAQLEGGAPLLDAPAGASPDELGTALRAMRDFARDDEAARRRARQRLLTVAGAEARAALGRRAASERPFVERLVAFWSNHLCVSAGAKLLVAPLAGSYEREAIRPHVLGRFEEMVLAATRHPAMLLYLDNFQSIGPASRAGRLGRGDARRGLNENHARELLELHTLGVDGGYTQQDVLELARLLTGWTVDGLPLAGGLRGAALRRLGAWGPADGPIRFAFRAVLHEPGEKRLLGATYASSGVEAGEDAIRALCRHPATARFVATKLVAHFVADTPPPAAVARVEGEFRDGGGDLRRVAAALVELPEAWSPESRKFRTPQDWLVAVLRAFGAAEVNDGVAPALRQLRHPLWAPPSPKGFGDAFAEWADPDALLSRAELARSIARRVVTRPVDPRPLLDVVEAGAADPLRALLADASIPADERVALAIAGPAFQWR